MRAKRLVKQLTLLDKEILRLVRPYKFSPTKKFLWHLQDILFRYFNSEYFDEEKYDDMGGEM